MPEMYDREGDTMYMIIYDTVNPYLNLWGIRQDDATWVIHSDELTEGYNAEIGQCNITMEWHDDSDATESKLTFALNV